MFGTNEITGQRAFKDAPMNSLQVVSIFYTIQGEGPLSGRPAVFVRLAKCNLACSFCDTTFDKGTWMTFDEIEEKAWNSISPELRPPEYIHNKVILVITGGEPTLQPNLSGFLLGQSGKWAEIQVESNGLIERLLPLGTVLVVSPKCTEPMLPPSGSLKRGHYLKPLTAQLMRADALKFVVDSNPLNAYHMPPAWADQWMHEQEKPVYISPMNAYQEGKPLQLLRDGKGAPPSIWTPGLLDRARNEANHAHAADLCMKFGYHLSLQTHLYAGLA